MDKKLIVRIFAAVLAAILLLGLITPAFAAEAGESSSVGIIGGADGPTAIFVTTSPTAGGLLSTILLIAGAVCLAAAIATLSKKKKK